MGRPRPPPNLYSYAIALASGGVALDSARHAALRLDDDPSPGEDELVSLWQTNSRAVRAERRFAFAVQRDGAVVEIDGHGWAPVVPD
jgi:hypothetical protein